LEAVYVVGGGEADVKRFLALLLLAQILISLNILTPLVVLSDVSIYQGIPVQILINTYPTSITIGSTFTITGKLVCANNASGIPSEGVYLEISMDGGNTWSTISSTTTNKKGDFSISAIVLKYVDTLYIRLYHPANATSKTGEGYSEVITAPVKLRELKGDVSVPQTIYAKVRYIAQLGVTDVTNTSLDYTGYLSVGLTLSGTDMIIYHQTRDDIIYTTYSDTLRLSAGALRDTTTARVEFTKAGDKTITLAWSSPFYKPGSTTADVHVQKQTPKLKYIYVVRRTDATYLTIAFEEIDGDPATDLPITSVKINDVEVLTDTVYTNRNGYATVQIPSSIAQQGVPVVITTSDTDAYAGSTYQTTLDLRLPTRITVGANVVSAGEPATLTIQVIDVVNGNYVSNGSVTINVYDQGWSYTTSITITESSQITATIPADVVRANPFGTGELVVYVTYSGSNTYQPSSTSAYFDVPPKPAYITLLYNETDATQTVYCYNQVYTFKAVVEDTNGNPLSNVFVYVKYSGDIIASGKTGNDGATYLNLRISAQDIFSIYVYIKDPNGIYFASKTYSLRSILCETNVLKVNVYESYTISKSGLSDFIGRRAILYRSNVGWEKLEQLDGADIVSSSVSFTRMETKPGTYYYVIDVVDANNNSLVSFRYTVIAKYKLGITVIYPNNINAGSVVDINVMLFRWDDMKWVSHTDASVYVYETGIYHYTIEYRDYRIYGYWDYKGQRQIGVVNILAGTQNKLSFFTYRYAGVYGAPPITLKFYVPETDINWELVNYYNLVVQPVLIDGYVTVSTTQADGTKYSRNFGLYSACYDFIRIPLGTAIDLSISITANTNLQLMLPIAVYYTDYSRPDIPPNPKAILTSLANAYTGQSTTLKFLLPPNHYTDGVITPYGPIYVRVLGADLVPPSDILQFYNVLVEPNSAIRNALVAGVSDPTIYKKGTNLPIPILGVVIGGDGTPLYNEQILIKLTSGANTVISNSVYSDFNGVFTYTLMLEKIPSGKYTLEISAPAKPSIKPFKATVTVVDSGGLFIITVTPLYVFKEMGFASSVFVYEGDPVPVEGYQLDVWYSNVVYANSDKLTWTYLGKYVTDYTGMISANVPTTATVLEPDKVFGWLYVLAVSAGSNVDPNKAYTSQSQVEQLLNAGKTYILASPEVLEELEQILTPSTNATTSKGRLGGSAEPLPYYWWFSALILLLTAGLLIKKVGLKNMRKSLAVIALFGILAVVVAAVGGAFQVTQAAFTGVSDTCIRTRTVGLSPNSITIDVEPIMQLIHLSPFVRGVEIYGVFRDNTVAVSGNAGEMTYQVINSTIMIGPKDLDRITGLREPLYITLKPTENITMACINYYNLLVRVVNGSTPVALAQVELTPTDRAHSAVYSVSNSKGDAVLNYLPDKDYMLNVKVNNNVINLNLKLTEADDGKTLVVDVSSGRVAVGQQTYQATVKTVTPATNIPIEQQQVPSVPINMIAIVAVVAVLTPSIIFAYKYRLSQKSRK